MLLLSECEYVIIQTIASGCSWRIYKFCSSMYVSVKKRQEFWQQKFFCDIFGKIEIQSTIDISHLQIKHFPHILAHIYTIYFAMVCDS